MSCVHRSIILFRQVPNDYFLLTQVPCGGEARFLYAIDREGDVQSWMNSGDRPIDCCYSKCVGDLLVLFGFLFHITNLLGDGLKGVFVVRILNLEFFPWVSMCAAEAKSDMNYLAVFLQISVVVT